MLSDASKYGVGMILVKAGSLIVIPLYWKLLSPEDFGIIAVFQLIFQFLIPVLDFGYATTVQRLYFEWPAAERKKYLGAVFFANTIMALVVCGILASLYKVLPEMLFQKSARADVYLYGIGVSFLMNFSSIPSALYRSRQELNKFIALGLFQLIAQSGMILFILHSVDAQVSGYLLGQFLGSLLIAIVFLVLLQKELSFSFFSKKYFAEPLKFALPLTPAVILAGASVFLDRFFLEKKASLATLGIYALGLQFGAGYNYLLNILKSAFIPFINRVAAERSDAAHVLSESSIYYVFIIAVPAVMGALAAQDFIVLLNNPKYFEVGVYVPYFIAGYFIQGMGHVLTRGLDLAKKTIYTWSIYFVSIVTTLLCVYFLFNRYGVWGALSSFIIANLVRESYSMYIAVKVFPREVKYKKIAIIVGASLLTFFLLKDLNVGITIVNLGLKLILAAVILFGFSYVIFDKRIINSVLGKILVKAKLK
jgi:O-antigen/teichoic acid export membrane protein